MNLNHGCEHRVFAVFLGQFAGMRNFLQGELIFSLFSVSSPFPKTSEHDDMIFRGFRLRLQYKIKSLDGRVDFLSGECPKSFNHAQAKVVVQGKLTPRYVGEFEEK